MRRRSILRWAGPVSALFTYGTEAPAIAAESPAPDTPAATGSTSEQQRVGRSWAVGGGFDVSGPAVGVGALGFAGTGVQLFGELRLAHWLWLTTQLRGAVHQGGEDSAMLPSLSVFGAALGLRLAFNPDQPTEVSTFVHAEGNELCLATDDRSYAALGGAVGIQVERAIADHFGLRVGVTLARAGYLRMPDADERQAYLMAMLDPALQLRAHF